MTAAQMTSSSAGDGAGIATKGSTEKRRLEGSLGVPSIVFMVIAAAAPITVIGGNSPIAIGNGPGSGAPLGFLIAGVVMILFSVGFVTMTPFVKEAGAFFSYVATASGARMGVGTAFTALVTYYGIQIGCYGYVGWAIGDLVTAFGGPDIPWPVYSFAAIAVVSVIGYHNIDVSSKFLAVALVCEIGIVCVLDAAVFVNGGPEGISWHSFGVSHVTDSGFGIAILYALTGFIGFESTAVYRDEAKNPSRTIPLATYAAVLIIGVFYTISTWALVTGAGASKARSVALETVNGNANMMIDMAGQYAGAVVKDVMQVLLVTSIFACVLSFHNIISRYQFTLANKGVLPTVLGVAHPRHDAPSRSSILTTVLGALLLLILVVAGLDPLGGVFGYCAAIATCGMMILMLVSSASVFVFFRRHREIAGNPVTTTIVPLLASLGLAACLVFILVNFTMVTGGSMAVSVILALIPFLAFAGGFITAAVSPRMREKFMANVL